MSARPPDHSWRELGAAGARALGEGRASEAAALFAQVVAARPDHADSWFNLGYARRQARDYRGALAAYDRALELGVAGPEAVRVNRALILSDHLDRVEAAAHERARARDTAPRFVHTGFPLAELIELFRAIPSDSRKLCYSSASD
ncbi:MAG: tetratricopeptide repeat protein [Cypionkella sp.]